jgi:hypothetical protein
VLLAVVALFLAGCGQAGTPPGQPSTTIAGTGSASPYTTAHPSPSATIPAVAAIWRLRYVLLGHYPTFAYCDPDLYPVARLDEQAAADRWWSSVDHSSPEVAAILAQHRYREPLGGAETLASYRDHKKLTVIAMTSVGAGYEYQLSVSATNGGEPDETITGVIAVDGTIHETGRRARVGGCPICLEAGTRIATPHGDVAVALVRPGDEVWTRGADGDRVLAKVERVVRRETPGPHLMLRLALSDGRELVAAGAHPAADGTYLRQLRPGQRFDGATVISADWVVSSAPATFDILPTGPTGTYWANGILIGSTLTP